MIESLADLNFEPEDTEEQAELKVQEKLVVSFAQLKDKLFSYIKENAETLTLDITNIAPNGNYENMLEDNDSMAEFLKTDACNYDKWKLNLICQSDVNKNLIQFKFRCEAVDDGDSFFGFVFVDKNGNIKHAFANSDS